MWPSITCGISYAYFKLPQARLHSRSNRWERPRAGPRTWQKHSLCGAVCSICILSQHSLDLHRVCPMRRIPLISGSDAYARHRIMKCSGRCVRWPHVWMNARVLVCVVHVLSCICKVRRIMFGLVPKLRSLETGLLVMHATAGSDFEEFHGFTRECMCRCCYRR